EPTGLVVTNNQGIEGADQGKISLSDKREFEAEIVLKDSRTDLAVLRLKDTREKFPTLDFANSDERSEERRVGKECRSRCDWSSDVCSSDLEAEIVLKDSRTDLAVLRLKDTREKFPTLDFANSDE